MLSWRKKTSRKAFPAHLMPTKADLEHDVRKLLQAADIIASSVQDEFERLSCRSKLSPLINAKADAVLSAYALIHLHFRHLGFPKGSKAVMTFAVFRSQMLTIYLVKFQPNLPGMPTLTAKDMMNTEFREAGAGTLKRYEDYGARVQTNLDRNAPYPFFPLYENGRPYLGPQATVMELNQAFDSLYASLSGQAQMSVEDIL